MSVFDLATNNRRAIDDEAEQNRLRLEDQGPGAFAGFFSEAQKSWMGASARGGQSIGMSAAPVAMAIDKAQAAGDWLAWQTLPEDERAHREAFGLTPKASGTEVQDWYFEHVIDDTLNQAVDHWKPNPEAMGSASKAISMVAEVGGSIPQMFGTLPVFLAQSGISPATELVRQGVDADTAGAVGAVNLGATAVGMRLPAAWGSTLTQRIATGAGSNLALGVAADAGSSEVLEAGGYEQQAKAYDAADPYARGLDILMGAAFGVRAHVDAPRLTPSQRDAVLTARNNEHFHRQTMPGEPASPAAARAHADALSEAIGQALRGEPVNVAGVVDLAAFNLRPDVVDAFTPARVDYGAYLVALESGGRADARATTSSATGLHQFTDGTWIRTVRAARPAWAEGRSDAEVLAMRTDATKSTDMEQALRAENTAALHRAGQLATLHNLYAAHHFGAKRGVEFARAADDTPMARILSPEQLAANPYLRGKTKAEAIANWDVRAARAGVQVPARDASGLAFDPIEVPPALSFDGPEAGRVIDQHLSELDDGAARYRLEPEEATALQQEESGLVALLQVSERADVDPRARLNANEVETGAARLAEVRRTLEQHQASVEYGRQAVALRGQLDGIERDVDLVRLAERLAGVDDVPARQRQADQAAPARAAGAAAARGDRSPAAASRALLGDSAARVEAGETVAAEFGPLRVEAIPGGFRVVDSLDPADATAAAAQLGAPARASGAQASPAGADATAGATTLAAARRISEARPELTITLDDGSVVPVARALADADALVSRAQSDSRAFAAAMACAMRFL